MMPSKEKVITGFKILSIFLITLMLVDLYNAFNTDEFSTKSLNLNKNLETKIQKIFTKKINSFCFENSLENSFEKSAGKIQYQTNSYMYYSFAVILGAFINAKKIMKIGVI